MNMISSCHNTEADHHCYCCCCSKHSIFFLHILCVCVFFVIIIIIIIIIIIVVVRLICISCYKRFYSLTAITFFFLSFFTAINLLTKGKFNSILSKWNGEIWLLPHCILLSIIGIWMVCCDEVRDHMHAVCNNSRKTFIQSMCHCLCMFFIIILWYYCSHASKSMSWFKFEGDKCKYVDARSFVNRWTIPIGGYFINIQS